MDHPIRAGGWQHCLLHRPDAGLRARHRQHRVRQTRRVARRDYYLKDKACPVNYEPSGEDFLSCLAEADVVRRLLPTTSSPAGSAFLPRIDLEPTRVSDPSEANSITSPDSISAAPGCSRHRLSTAVADKRRTDRARRSTAQAGLEASRANTTKAATGSAASPSTWSAAAGTAMKS